MANIYDIAKKAGVSIATVSKVINDRPDVSENTKKKIKKIMKECNYVPNSVARSLTTNESQSVGIIFNYEREQGLTNMFFQEIIFGMDKVLGTAGYDYVYFSEQKWHDFFEYDYLGKCKNRMVDGAILLGVHQNNNMMRLLESSLPVVLIDLDIANNSTSYVKCNHKEGAKKAVEYLYQLGHRCIAMIGPKNLKPARARLKGYKEVHNKQRLAFDEKWIAEAPFDENSGYQAMKELLKKIENLEDKSKRPTAVFCQSDVLAIGAIKAIRESGFDVPDDFSIVGFDDIEVCKYISPALTTVSQRSYYLGEKAADLLLEMIAHPEQAHEPLVLSTKLIKRDSCKRVEKL